MLSGKKPFPEVLPGKDISSPSGQGTGRTLLAELPRWPIWTKLPSQYPTARRTEADVSSNRKVAMLRIRECRKAFMSGEQIRSALLGCLADALCDSVIGAARFLAVARLFRVLACSEASREVDERVLRAATVVLEKYREPRQRRLHPGVLGCLQRLHAGIPGATLETAARAGRAVGVSSSHLTRLFRRQTGLSLRQWQSILRMKSAVVAMAASEEPVSQVAYSIGYSEPSRFSHEFQRMFGISPRQFRTSTGTR